MAAPVAAWCSRVLELWGKGTEMGRPGQANYTKEDGRVAWVDCAKGFCIVFVLMMHSTLGVGNALGAEGWLHAVVAFAKPAGEPLILKPVQQQA